MFDSFSEGTVHPGRAAMLLGFFVLAAIVANIF